jgi:hypothetical protein
MKLCHVCLLITTQCLGACGVSGSGSEERESLDAESLISSLVLAEGARAVVEPAYTGGATGDTQYKAWICQAVNSDCRLLAIVDTHDGHPPVWRSAPSGLELVVASRDVVWNFSNFSRLPGAENRTVKIRLVEAAR